MSLPYRVALQGFSPFERSALASYFRLAANRSPAYEQVDSAEEAHFIVVDAEHADAVLALLRAGRGGDTVFVGAMAPQGAAAWVMRPIDPLHVLRELDAMVAHQAAQQATPAPVAPGEHSGSNRVVTIIKQAAPRSRDASAAQAPTRRASDSDGSALLQQADAHQPVAPGPGRRGNRALLVDDSDIALRFLETRLQPLGLQTETAGTSVQAIELLSQKSYDFIFLDVELGPGSEMDGLTLCQHIKRQHHTVGGARSPAMDPVIVMVSAHHSELDRVRGTLAGADAYLGKPLDEAAVRRLLQQHGVQPPAATRAPAENH